MTPAKSSARRTLAGGALFVALGALGAASAAPAAAGQVVWGNAQAWVADGALVTGYSTAVSFGGQAEDEARADPFFGPLAEYAEVEGESRTLVEGTGVMSQAVVERAALWLGVEDLVDLGVLDPGGGEAGHSPSEEPGASLAEEEFVVLSEGVSENVFADGNAVGFTITDLRTSAAADFDGRTDATFEHGELTAFGEPVADFDGDHTVRETLEVLGEDGEVLDEVPVSVRFLANENVFNDEDGGWEGTGIRSWLTVSVQVGSPEMGSGFAVDFADSWAVGSTRLSVTEEDGSERGGRSGEEPSGAGKQLATTGSSIAALVTAAVVTVGGGSAATLLARKRTTAMDDRIGD